MTKRLEEAIKRLTPEQVDRLTDVAERIAAEAAMSANSRHLSLSWAGKFAKHYPQYASGVDAAHAAAAMWRATLERGK